MVPVRSAVLGNLSTFKTVHRFLRYGEFRSIEEFEAYRRWAHERGIPVFILGRGSNTLFTRRTVRSLVLKNCLPPGITPLSDRRIEVSSSTPIMAVLQYCRRHSLDSFYYLASVPATVGGALAMNAGRGRRANLSIYDAVESVTFLDDGAVKTLRRDQIRREYRHTIFTGVQSKLILSAVFKFKSRKPGPDPIVERLRWVREHQDNSAPNCGTVFKLADPRIMKRLRGFAIGKAQYSRWTTNRILNRSRSSRPIVWLIRVTRLAHLALRRPIALELIAVD